MNLKKIIIPALLAAFLFSGCSWMGKTTGKAVNKAEEGAHKIEKMPSDFEKGYNETRE